MRLDLKNLVRELDIILDRSGEVSARAVAFALKVSLKADGPQGIDQVQSQLVDLAADLGRVARRVDLLEKAAGKSPAPLYAGTCPLTMVPVDAGKPDAPATPDRTGQWFVDYNDCHRIHGPIIKSVNGRHECADGWWAAENQSIANKLILPIPPRPSDAALAAQGARLTGDVRRWNLGEMWIGRFGILLGPAEDDDTEWQRVREDLEGCGWRRWIAEKIPGNRPPARGTREKDVD